MSDASNGDEYWQEEEPSHQELTEAAYIIASSLQATGGPSRALQILSLATGMSICASCRKRDGVGDIMKMFNEQVKNWCDFEEGEKTASWLKCN